MACPFQTLPIMLWHCFSQAWQVCLLLHCKPSTLLPTSGFSKVLCSITWSKFNNISCLPILFKTFCWYFWYRYLQNPSKYSHFIASSLLSVFMQSLGLTTQFSSPEETIGFTSFDCVSRKNLWYVSDLQTYFYFCNLCFYCCEIFCILRSLLSMSLICNSVGSSLCSTES